MSSISDENIQASENSEFQGINYNQRFVVYHSFTEFAALWARLHILKVNVPSLPQKHQRMSKKELVRFRRKELNVWIQKLLLKTPGMCKSGITLIKFFLTPTTTEI